METVFLLVTTLFLSYSNGANDNYKGVATLWGSSTTSYRGALLFATVATLLGSFLSLSISTRLIPVFSGKGLVPDSVVGNPYFLISVAAGGGATVWIATLAGFPISTTHSLTGALMGAGYVAVGSGMNVNHLGHSFLLPLLVSPLLAFTLTVFLHRGKTIALNRLGSTGNVCVCSEESGELLTDQGEGTAALTSSGVSLSLGREKNCEQNPGVRIWRLDSGRALNSLHYLSAGLVSFSRGLNDTPKIVALLLGMKIMSLPVGIGFVALLMAAGALFHARKVAYVMSKEITEMDHTEGFTANFVTALLVLFASRYGVPVSTTHVSCGSIFGIGFVGGKAQTGVIGQIALSWLVTLPVAALFAGVIFFALK